MPYKSGGLLPGSRRKSSLGKNSPEKDHGAEKEGYSEGVREHTTVCDLAGKSGGPGFMP